MVKFSKSEAGDSQQEIKHTSNNLSPLESLNKKKNHIKKD